MNLPHKLRLRPDLRIERQDPACGTWVVKDPVALRFFLFGPDEHFILRLLDGTRSADEILDEFARERAPKRMTARRLHGFLASLCRNGLATSGAPGHGARLLENDRRRRFRESMLGWTNVLAIRLPGVNPDAALTRLYPALRWCFSPWLLLCCALVWLAAIGIVISEADTLGARLPRMEEFVSGRNLIWLAVALAGTKVLHELAHALACKHFGGHCHELGVMLLVLTPCLYCNVTDSWMLRSRWQRIAISAAGILMELQLAAVAVIVWRFTHPGTINSNCLNTILVCSVGTLLFNGNPLLRYDGYYILSDLTRVPNLWQESRARLSGSLRSWLLGAEPPVGDERPARRAFLILYALASIAYRICLMVVILLLVYRWAHPLGLDLLLVLVVASVAGALAVSWAAPVARWANHPLSWRRLRKAPAAFLLCTGAAAAGAVLWIPLPCRIAAPAVLQTTGAKRVFVSTPGVLMEAARPGDEVQRGQALATLENPELRDERLRVQGDLGRASVRVRALEARQSEESAAAAQLAVAREILADLTEQARLRDQEQRMLTLRAPTGGQVIQPPRAPAARPDDRQLPAWHGTPLDEDNLGCRLDRGALLCLVGDPRSLDAVVYVDELDVRHVRVGQRARVRLEHALADVLAGRVVEVAELDAQTMPAELAAQRDVVVRGDDPFVRSPQRTMYQVRVELGDHETPTLIGARGQAKIEVDPQTIAERLVRWLRRTLTIDPAARGA